MRKTRRLGLGIIGLLIVLGLVTGCFRQQSPDVTPTAAGGAQAAPTDEGMPDLEATSRANSTIAAEAGAGAPTAESGEDTTPTDTPTSPPPTETPTQPPATAQPTTVPTTAPGATPVPTTAPSGEVKHVVQRGENLFRIALRYGTTVQAIASANGIANPSLIYVGQVLTIPVSGTPAPQPGGGTTYVVRAGDNLFRIALRHNMSYLYLAQYNGIADPSRIYVGQVLRIPPR